MLKIENNCQTFKGSSLIMVLSLVSVLSAALVGGLFIVNYYAQQVGSNKAQQQAHFQAEKGLAIALHLDVTNNDDVLQFVDAEEEQGYSVIINSENAKFNLNTLIQNQQGIDILTRILIAKGLDMESRDILIGSFIDWVDANDLSQLNGAEKQWYKEQGFDYIPSNQPFTSLDEVLLVRGMDELIKVFPDWQQWFTFKTDRKLDINEAPIDRLELLTSYPLSNWSEVKSQLLGLDQLEGTTDDYRYTELTEVYQDLAVTAEQQLELAPWIGVNTYVHELEAVGWFNSESKSIQLWVENKSQGTPKILERKVKIAKHNSNQ